MSHKTIYRRIYAEIRSGRLDRKHLRWDRKNNGGSWQKRVLRDASKTSIEDRLDLSSRAEFGHWEGDIVELVCGKRYLVTMVERKMRFWVMFRHFPRVVKSIALDNGNEFADHKTIASRLNAPVCFTHPHSPWERGTNENTNRLLRQ